MFNPEPQTLIPKVAHCGRSGARLGRGGGRRARGRGGVRRGRLVRPPGLLLPPLRSNSGGCGAALARLERWRVLTESTLSPPSRPPRPSIRAALPFFFLQKVAFLQKLSAHRAATPLAPAAARGLGELYGLRASRNAEIRLNYFLARAWPSAPPLHSHFPLGRAVRPEGVAQRGDPPQLLPGARLALRPPLHSHFPLHRPRNLASLPRTPPGLTRLPLRSPQLAIAAGDESAPRPNSFAVVKPRVWPSAGDRRGGRERRAAGLRLPQRAGPHEVPAAALPRPVQGAASRIKDDNHVDRNFLTGPRRASIKRLRAR